MFANQATVFRFLVLASLITAILAGCVDFAIPGLLPPELDDAYEAYTESEEPTVAFLLLLGVFSIVLLIGVVVATVGLLLFKWWSRPFSFWMTIPSTAIYPLMGPSVYSGWASMLTEISMMMWGAALAMAYFADIKVKFARPSP